MAVSPSRRRTAPIRRVGWRLIARPSPKAHDPVGVEEALIADKMQAAEDRLSDQHSIEWIGMVARE